MIDQNIDRGGDFDAYQNECKNGNSEDCKFGNVHDHFIKNQLICLLITLNTLFSLKKT